MKPKGILIVVALVMFGMGAFWPSDPWRTKLIAAGLFFWVLSNSFF